MNRKKLTLEAEAGTLKCEAHLTPKTETAAIVDNKMVACWPTIW